MTRGRPRSIWVRSPCFGSFVPGDGKIVSTTSSAGAGAAFSLFDLPIIIRVTSSESRQSGEGFAEWEALEAGTANGSSRSGLALKIKLPKHGADFGARGSVT